MTPDRGSRLEHFVRLLQEAGCNPSWTEDGAIVADRPGPGELLDFIYRAFPGQRMCHCCGEGRPLFLHPEWADVPTHDMREREN
jgi:hypothetical protein